MQCIFVDATSSCLAQSNQASAICSRSRVALLDISPLLFIVGCALIVETPATVYAVYATTHLVPCLEEAFPRTNQ